MLWLGMNAEGPATQLVLGRSIKMIVANSMLGDSEKEKRITMLWREREREAEKWILK